MHLNENKQLCMWYSSSFKKALFKLFSRQHFKTRFGKRFYTYRAEHGGDGACVSYSMAPAQLDENLCYVAC